MYVYYIYIYIYIYMGAQDWHERLDDASFLFTDRTTTPTHGYRCL